MATQDLIIPKHIAIIMDGNGRWAKSRGLPRYEGHRQGAKVVKQIVTAAKKLGVRYITLYTFSSENWQRPEIEVKALMKLLEEYLKNELKLLKEEGVRLRTIGDTSKLPPKLLQLLDSSMSETEQHAEMDLILALSYGARQEIVDAARNIHEASLAGNFDINSLAEDNFGQFLYAPDVPDPELLIRTSDEKRLSNFLLWQLSYAEFVFVPEFWPDFTPEVLERCIEEFNDRGRRFGKV